MNVIINKRKKEKKSNLQSAVSKALTVETVIVNLRDLRYSYSSNAFCQFLAWNKHLPIVSSMVNSMQGGKDLKKHNLHGKET